jgi:hypothetical protein
MSQDKLNNEIQKQLSTFDRYGLSSAPKANASFSKFQPKVIEAPEVAPKELITNGSKVYCDAHDR